MLAFGVGAPTGPEARSGSACAQSGFVTVLGCRDSLLAAGVRWATSEGAVRLLEPGLPKARRPRDGSS